MNNRSFHPQEITAFLLLILFFILIVVAINLQDPRYVILGGLPVFVISLILLATAPAGTPKEIIEQENISKGIQKIEMVCECGAVYPAGAAYCAICGKQLTKRIVDNYVWKCPECGKIFENGEKFCPEHGKELVKSPKE